MSKRCKECGAPEDFDKMYNRLLNSRKQIEQQLQAEQQAHADLVEKLKWIKTEYNQPTESKHYLCWCVDGFGNKGYEVRYWDNNRNGFYPKNPNNLSNTEKYWQPLPKSPIDNKSNNK